MRAPRFATPELANYFITSYAALLLNVAGALRDVPRELLALAFALAVAVTYSALYLLPVAIAVFALHALLRGRARRVVIPLAAVLGVALLQFSLFADRAVFRIYGFHANSFVWNLLTTRGGIESMDSGPRTIAAVAAIGVGFLVLQAALWRAAAGRAVHVWLARLRRSRAVWLYLAAFLLLGLGERATYALAYSLHGNGVLAAADVFPYYIPTRVRQLTRALGIEPSHTLTLEAAAPGRLEYPLQPIQRGAHKRYNVIWLVAESLRADALDPEIMPATYAFAQHSLWFRQHYSGGNNTRMGMFSMFYGLYGGYWFAFQDQERAPVLMDVLREDHYQLALYTSARFTYPEFNETIFAGVPRAELHESKGREGWVEDRENVGKLLAALDARDASRPFFGFMFFESPHARYHFPPESVVRTPYLDELNYATMDLARDMPLIKNRYLNAVHHLDSQLERVFQHLAEQKLLDSTIVVVTGDHGEEFMEKGRWGHASGFSEEQTRVPLVLYVPGEAPRQVQRMTSHLDLPATVMTLLGVTNPPSDYSLGRDLLHGPERSFTVVSGWDALAYVDGQRKMMLPLGRFDVALRSKVTARDDSALPALGGPPILDRSSVLGILRDLTRFARSRS
jgi:hypothetical protein